MRSRRGAALGLCVLALMTLTQANRQVSSAAGATVSGTVSGSDQGFMSGANVVIEASPRREARTDADGRFTITDVPTGTHRFLVSAEGYLPLDRTIEVGSAAVSVDIVLLKLPGVP